MSSKLSKKDIYERAKNIKLIATDVDGVLTEGEVIFTGEEKEIKVWTVRDGLGFTILRMLGGIKVAWVTGRSSESVANRAKELKIDYLVQGTLTKKQAIDKIIKEAGISLNELAYIGDDIVDLSALESAGLAFCPNDAVAEVLDTAHHVVPIPGGKGVFRYVVELILKAQGRWQDALQLFR
ncbi:MAG: HAD hydrolase family protein [Elusimicrobiota bacterium]